MRSREQYLKALPGRNLIAKKIPRQVTDWDLSEIGYPEMDLALYRRPLGYLRYDTPEELALINDLCRNELGLYRNLFQPVLMLRHNERVAGKVRGRYATPQIPYRILRESGQLSPDKVREPDALYHRLNPAEPKKRDRPET